MSYTKQQARDWKDSIDRGRCYVCNWQLQSKVANGCVVFNCASINSHEERRRRSAIQEEIRCAIMAGAS